MVFKPVLINPNEYLFSDEVDGLKSYFNFSYYLKYDEGIRHDGINYPYGDHLQYINSHPLYVQVLKFIDHNVYEISPYGVAILNLTMIFSLLIAVNFIYLILRRFNLPRWYSFLLSLLILFLSPQIDRIGGHFEMVYAFFIPLYWYLLIRWREGNKQMLWATLMILTALIGGFTSAYFVTFFSIFTLALFLVEIWNYRKHLSDFIKPGLTLLVVAILPLIMVKGLVNITDWVDDRPENPWGFFIFHSNTCSIFLPFHSFISTPISKIVDTSFEWEGRSFIGIIATLFSIAILVVPILYLLRFKKPKWEVILPDNQLNTFLAASFIVLLFSMCIPFKLNMEFLLDILPQLRQFRCLGRFSWIFYYVVSVYAAYFVYTLYKRLLYKDKKIWAYLLLVISMGVWAFDAKTNYLSSTKDIFNENDKLKVEEDEYIAEIEKAGVHPEDYQAIFFLPFSNTCGDKLLSERGGKAFSEAMRYSNLTGLPIIQSFSPRLSFTHALSNYQLLASPAIYKTRIDDMNEKPLLILISKDELNEAEKRVSDLSEVLYEDEHIFLASMPVNALNDLHNRWRKGALNQLDSLPCHNNICTNFNAEDIYYNDFEDHDSENVFTGKGAWYKEEGSIDLFNKELYQSDSTEMLEISFWLFFDVRTHNMPSPSLYLLDKDGKNIERIRLENRKIFDVYGRWVRISTTISPQSNISYKLVVDGKYITVDDLLIRPVQANVAVHHKVGKDLYNNYPIDF